MTDTPILNEISIEDRPELTMSDVGKLALYHPNGETLAIAETLAECIDIGQRITGDEIDIETVCTDDDWDLESLCAARITK